MRVTFGGTSAAYVNTSRFEIIVQVKQIKSHDTIVYTNGEEARRFLCVIKNMQINDESSDCHYAARKLGQWSPTASWKVDVKSCLLK